MEYLRECGINYLRYPMAGQIDYRMKMLLCNHPSGFLPMEHRRVDEWEWIYCRVNGLLSLQQRLERERLREKDLKSLFASVETLCHSMEEYLLPFETVMLNPEYIYVKPTGEWDCYWIYGADCSDGAYYFSVEQLVEYLLNHLNYEDRNAVRLLYEIYQACRGSQTIDLLRDAYHMEMSRQENMQEDSVYQRETETRQSLIPEKADALNSKPEPERMVSNGYQQTKEQRKGFFFQLIDTLSQFTSTKKVQQWKAQNKMFVSPKKEQMTLPVSVERIEATAPQNVSEEMEQGTTLLTGGMQNGGIYCLRAKSSVYQDVLLTAYPFFIGKDEAHMDGVVEDSFVSRYHARIDREGTCFRVMDLGSTNGTFLNQERLQPYESRVIETGDLLVFAQREYEFCFLR